MPRAHRHIQSGYTYHVTHRCHDRTFLLKFARDRQLYRKWLLKGLKIYQVQMLTYCITSNHVHLLVRSAIKEDLSRFMQYVQGSFALAYNKRKKRTGAFWSDRYHASMIEDGEHLWRCLRYIDLNMVRARVVQHPREWEWTGWGELMGDRKRNRVLDVDLLVSLLNIGDIHRLREQYIHIVNQTLSAGHPGREPWWSESVAVGSSIFVEKIQRDLLSDYTRKQIEISYGDHGIVTLRETKPTYGPINDTENQPIACFNSAETDLTY